MNREPKFNKNRKNNGFEFEKGEDIHIKVARLMESGMSLEGLREKATPPIYTKENEDNRAYNINTDKFDLVLEALETVGHAIAQEIGRNKEGNENMTLSEGEKPIDN